MKKFIKLLIIVSLFGFSLNLLWNIFLKPQEFISPIAKTTTIDSSQKQTNSPNLQKAVDNVLAGARGNYGIAIKNLKTGETYFVDAHKVFQPGSLYKLWIMAETFKQLEGGKLTENEILNADIQDLNNESGIDKDTAELIDGTVTLSVKTALEQMITISHNYAALLLTKRLKLSNVENFLKQNNLNESIVGDLSKTTPYDIALFFEKLYKWQLANEGNTQKMIALLKRQTLNDKLPKYLPQNIPIAHKTGEIDYFSHDGGIVFGEKGDYIIVVLSESDYPPGAEERIAQISQAVYQYFAGKKYE